MRRRTIAAVLAGAALAACDAKENDHETLPGVDAREPTSVRTEVDAAPGHLPGVDAASDSASVDPERTTTADSAPRDTPR